MQTPIPNPFPNRLGQGSEKNTVVATREYRLAPDTANAAAEILAAANVDRAPVAFVGGGTKEAMGNPAAPASVTITTRALHDIIAYRPEDLTVTVGAGLRLADLHALLADKGQWLPLDPPHLPGATIGGVLATNVSGPKRLLYGTARDLLIGCQFVLADGTLGQSGGRVVKNVAGYDLHKLMIGAYGTLGLLTEVTFKVLPLPQYSAWGAAAFATLDAALAAARTAAGANIGPAALEVLNRTAAQMVAAEVGLPIADAPYSLFFAAEGVAVAVRDQMAALADLCRAAGAVDILRFAESATVWPALRDLPTRPACDTRLAWSATLTDLPATVARAERLAAELGAGAALQVRAGTGVAYLLLHLDDAEAAEAITAARTADGARGSLVIETAPAALKARVDAFGPVGDALPAMAALKQTLDPHGILNAGRFITGL